MLNPFRLGRLGHGLEKGSRAGALPFVLLPGLLLPHEPMLRLYHLVQARLNGGQFGGALVQFPLEDVQALGEPDAVGCGHPQ